MNTTTTTTTTTTATDNAPFMEARQCRGCKVYRVDLYVDNDLCDDCDPDDTGFTEADDYALRAVYPTVDFHE